DKDGNLLWREEYKPYGERIKDEAAGSNNRWFTGKQEESDFGISYFGARWYDSGTGRFMGIDPIGYRDVHSFNRYAYANNNPYKFIDPDGRDSYDIRNAKYLNGGATPTLSCNGCQGAMGLAPGMGIVDGIKNISKGNYISAAIDILSESPLGKIFKGIKATESGSSTLYRAVSKAELDDIAANGVRTTEGGYELGKLFATTLDDAAQFGKNNFKLDAVPNHLIKFEVPNSVMKSATSFTADSMKAVSIPANQLKKLSSKPLNHSPVN
ncbi:MAG: RHS repeat-associated core domain-containing protein, partial [Planctomycetes bacterium]|nr:RHS repeat-associated core domain-containing protein [Planctomycetota bacterium]